MATLLRFRAKDAGYEAALGAAMDLVEGGLSVEGAARVAGVSVRTLRDRIDRGRKATVAAPEAGERLKADYDVAKAVWVASEGDAKVLAWCAMIRKWLALTAGDEGGTETPADEGPSAVQ